MKFVEKIKLFQVSKFSIAKFYYHQQSLDYVNQKLGEISNIEHGQEVKINSIAQYKPQSCLTSKSVAGGKGFEPLTLSLEG